MSLLLGWIASCINKARLGIGDFVEILPGTYLSDSKVEAHAVVDSSKVVNSCIKEGSYVGPMSYVSNNQIKK